MSKATHTPGPWYIAEHSWAESSIYCKEKTIATLSIRDEATENTQESLEKEMDANARLIAAAPDLLEVLKAIQPEITRLAYEARCRANRAKSRDCRASNHKALDKWNGLENKIDAAIAKAEGK